MIIEKDEKKLVVVLEAAAWEEMVEEFHGENATRAYRNGCCHGPTRKTRQDDRDQLQRYEGSFEYGVLERHLPVLLLYFWAVDLKHPTVISLQGPWTRAEQKRHITWKESNTTRIALFSPVLEPYISNEVVVVKVPRSPTATPAVPHEAEAVLVMWGDALEQADDEFGDTTRRRTAGRRPRGERPLQQGR